MHSFNLQQMWGNTSSFRLQGRIIKVNGNAFEIAGLGPKELSQ